jgi:hypothetical protein
MRQSRFDPKVDQGLEQDFRIAGGSQFDPGALQTGFQRTIIVEFTVVDQTESIASIPKGLVAPLVQVHQRQSCVHQPDTPVGMNTISIGTTVMHPSCRLFEQIAPWRGRCSMLHDAENSAHVMSFAVL